MAKKSTPLQKEYNKHLTRVNRLVKSLESRGYGIEQKILDKLNKPEKIRRYHIEALKKITPDYLYKHSIYVKEDGTAVAGVVGRDIERSKAAKKGVTTKKRKESARKRKEAFEKGLKQSKSRDEFYKDREDEQGYGGEASFSGNVLSRVLAMCEDWIPRPYWSTWFADIKENDKNDLQYMLFEQIGKYGEDTVAERLEKNSVEVVTLVEEILYGSGTEGLEASFGRRAYINAAFTRLATILKGKPLTKEESIHYTDLTEKAEYE